MNGPGGYFGRCLNGVSDAMCGNFGATSSFPLIWHDAHIARECLGLSPRVDIRPEIFEELLAFLAGRRIDVRLA